MRVDITQGCVLHAENDLEQVAMNIHSLLPFGHELEVFTLCLSVNVEEKAEPYIIYPGYEQLKEMN